MQPSSRSRGILKLCVGSALSNIIIYKKHRVCAINRVCENVFMHGKFFNRHATHQQVPFNLADAQTHRQMCVISLRGRWRNASLCCCCCGGVSLPRATSVQMRRENDDNSLRAHTHIQLSIHSAAETTLRRV
jgi:hypothetical protein